MLLAALFCLPALRAQNLVIGARDDLARRQAGKVSVVLLSREGADKIVPLFEGTNYAFAVALDDEGKTFDAYGVKFVPFSVLLDAKGRVLWFGNSSRLTSQDLDGLLAK